MKLKSLQIKHYRSIEDSEEFSIGDITCLVGKNESGKTAVLRALLGFNPHEGPPDYDIAKDYPRHFVTKYNDRHADHGAEICITKWQLEDADNKAVENAIMPGCLNGTEIVVTSRYDGYRTWDIPLDEKKVRLYLAGKPIVSEPTEGMESTLEKIRHITGEAMLSHETVSDSPEQAVTDQVAFILGKRFPKFLYFSHYSLMSGALSVEKWMENADAGNEPSAGDRLFLDFLEYSGTSIDQIQNIQTNADLKAILEDSSKTITQNIFKYWKQTKGLEIEFDVSYGRSDDKPPFNSGLVIRARVKNQLHRTSVEFSERSSGFIWFFSFLVHFSQVRKKSENDLIILLDEPGLSLHAKAQHDLLRYMQEELTPHHQVIYTTHSPFMIISDRLDTVRVVEDVTEDNGDNVKTLGTKVQDEALGTNKDTVFPLQAALGYDIAQTLFIGEKILLVEGPADLLYLQAISAALEDAGRTALDKRWSICPSGGVGNIASFIRLFMAHRVSKEIVAVIDYNPDDQRQVSKLANVKQLAKVFTFADCCGGKSADIEDMFERSLYLHMVNEAYNFAGKKKITDTDIENASETRLVKAVEKCFLQTTKSKLNHFKPAKWLMTNSHLLDTETPGVKETLDRFEDLFSSINAAE